MSTSDWKEVRLATERALSRTVGDASLLFGLGPARTVARYDERTRRLMAALAGQLQALRWCRQVHGAELRAVEEPPADSATCIGSCDGLITSTRGVGLLVWTADCVPMLIVGGSVVAAIHVGWRGAAAGIVPAAIERATLRYGLEPGSAKAFLGPAVAAANYPVGPEVIGALSAWRLDRRRWLDGSRIDLRGFIAAQLEGLGVATVDRVGPCTASTPGLASYRRDGPAAGRQWSLIYRRPAT